jgi:hypothetical protein
MLEELQRRNYSHRTAKTYVRIVREFATYFHQPPDAGQLPTIVTKLTVEHSVGNKTISFRCTR